MYKILISGLFLYPTKVGGIENYFYNLLKSFTFFRNLNYFKVILNNTISISENDHIFKNFNHSTVNIKLNRGFYDYLINFSVKNIKEFDLFFSPNYITPLFLKIPKVTTIHDVQYLYYPEYFTKQKRIWLSISHLLTLKKANKIICISNSVKKDIIKFFGESFNKKLVVIHNPIDFGRFNHPEKKYEINKLPKNYILTVAAQYPHKNLLTLIKAFELVKKKYDYKLILVGQLGKNLIGGYSNYYNKLQEHINKTKDIIVTGYISDYYLGVLYKNCDFFVFPSLFEGFGMPPVEALGFGKPTLVSNINVLKEVTFGKAIYVNEPLNVDEWVDKIFYLIKNKEELSSYCDNIKNEIIQKYKPVKIAQKYLNTFEEVINAT